MAIVLGADVAWVFPRKAPVASTATAAMREIDFILGYLGVFLWSISGMSRWMEYRVGAKAIARKELS
jgi:hypothetical protein